MQRRYNTRRNHIAQYGNIKIPRGFCYECEGNALILDKKYACCGKVVDSFETDQVIQMSETIKQRKRPTAGTRRMLLEQFNHSCAYCFRKFGDSVMYRGVLKTVSINWDHEVPYSYGQNNEASNFLPACSFCNKFKSNKMFKTIEEVQIYVNAKWEERQAA